MTSSLPMQERIRSCLAKVQARFPNAVQMVYDNCNFLVIGLGPTRRPSDAIFSLAAQRSGITLFFLQHGPELPDPTRLLRDSGKLVRSLPLEAAEDLDRPDVQDLLKSALAMAAIPMETATRGELIIKSVSAKQRPRR